MENKNKKYLEIKPEHLEAVKRRKAAQERLKIPDEYRMVSELGYYYGWAAIKDFIDDVITIEQAEMWVRAAEKVHARHAYDNVIANLAARQTKSEKFKKLIKRFTDEMK